MCGDTALFAVETVFLRICLRVTSICYQSDLLSGFFFCFPQFLFSAAPCVEVERLGMTRRPSADAIADAGADVTWSSRGYLDLQ